MLLAKNLIDVKLLSFLIFLDQLITIFERGFAKNQCTVVIRIVIDEENI